MGKCAITLGHRKITFENGKVFFRSMVGKDVTSHMVALADDLHGVLADYLDLQRALEAERNPESMVVRPAQVEQKTQRWHDTHGNLVR